MTGTSYVRFLAPVLAQSQWANGGLYGLHLYRMCLAFWAPSSARDRDLLCLHK